MRTKNPIGVIEKNATSHRFKRDVIFEATNKTMRAAAQAWYRWLRESGTSENYIYNCHATLEKFIRDMELEDVRLAELNPETIRGWVNTAGPTKLSSRKVYLAMLKSFFKFMHSHGWLFFNPAEIVRVDRRKLSHEQIERKHWEPFTNEEFERLLSVIPSGSFWYTAAVISRYSGLRMIDIAMLEWRSIEKPGVIVVHTKKTGSRVEIPITNSLMQEVISCISADPNDRFLFPTYAKRIEIPTVRSGMADEFKALCLKAGLQNKHFHLLRKTFAMSQQSAGVEITKVAALLGHASPATTQEHYLK